MIIYLSGPMTGIAEYNYPAFNAAAAKLRSKGYTVFNPAEISPPIDPTWENYMRACIRGLMDCSKVVTLPGWEKSKGANVEVKLALDLGMPIVEIGTQEIMKGS